MKRLNLILLAPIFLLIFIKPAWTANTLDVCPSGCTFNTIQGAIDAALDGDNVLVSSGTYTENILISGVFLTISSVSGAATTIIDGNSAGPVVSFVSCENKDSILDGFTIQNGMSTNGGGIHCDHASPLIRNCLIQNNTATQKGGGIYFYYSGSSLLDCNILFNSAGSDGGGIYNRYGVVNLTRCLISGNNSSGIGGGIDIVNSPSTLTNCAISGNSAVNGGGISTNAYPVITNCTVVGNTATGNGGGLYCPYSQPVVVNSIFWGNGEQYFGSPALTYSTVQGGVEGTGNLSTDPLFVNIAGEDYNLQIDSPAIDAASSYTAPADDINQTVRPQLLGYDMGAYEFVLSGCQPWASFTSNPVRVDVNDGLINFDASGTYNKEDADFLWDFGNGNNGSGQTISHTYSQTGIYTINLSVSSGCGSSSLTRENYIIVKPSGTDLNVPNDFATILEAINAAIDGDTVVIAPGIYTENINFMGKAITVQGSDGATVTIIDGNAAASVVTFSSGETSSSLLSDLTIRNGDADSGGGIYIENSSPTIIDCIITSNTAETGGGIYVKNDNPADDGPTIKRVWIVQNTSTLGGGIALRSAAAQLTNCLIVSNTANYGGGIYDEMASPNIFNCTVYGNTATSNGNGLYTFFSYAIITNSLLWDATPEISADISFPTFTNCNVMGGYAGTGNINTSPLLVNPAGGNYRPAAASPLVNFGTGVGAPSFDFDNNSRDGTVDIGAFEFISTNTDPTVTVDVPNGGEAFTGNSLIVHWTPVDNEQQGTDEMTANIYYRRGSVGNWVAIAGNVGCTHNVQATYTWDINNQSDANNYNLRIVISDGLGGSAEDTSDSFFTLDRTLSDSDGDGVADSTDNCPAAPNADQSDADGDGSGDACDTCTDTDGDGYGNPGYAANICTTDNCPDNANVNQEDADGDGLGDACDTCPNDSSNDVDGDGVCGDIDNCPTVANANQSDIDEDGIGDACDYSLPTNAISHWRFNEISGSIAFDETENSNDGTITGANWTTGKFGNALSFNGSSDYVSVANEDNFDMVDYLTIEAWVNLSDSSRSTLASKGSGASVDGGWIWDYGGWTAGQIEFGVLGGSGKYISAGAALPTGEWHHVVGVFNKDLSGNGRVKLFIDGVEQSVTYNSSGSFPTIMPNNRDVVIGGRYTGNLPFTGLIDEVVIYDRALSSSEVQDRFSGSNCTDADSDNYYASADCGTDIDCDDTNSNVNPGVAEICNGIDDNCDGQTDEGFTDADGDGIGDACDTCPDDSANDIDNDGVCGDVDNCPAVDNSNQADTDGDGLGDACDTCTDTDGDGYGNPGYAANICTTDNCPDNANASQDDTDGDSLGDVCDTCPNDSSNDVDGDGICGAVDNCPTVANANQSDIDEDGIGDACAEYSLPINAISNWKFNETSGSIAFDETENSNDGTINGASWTTGKFGNALSFNGSSDYVSVANEDNFDMVDYLTIEAWVNLSDSSRSTLASKGSGASADGGWIWDYGGWTTGQIEFGVLGGSGKYISAGAAMSTGEWHHVIGVFNKDLSGNSRVKLFIDGVEQSVTYNSSVSFSTIMPNNRDVVIGGRYTGNLPFTGLIDEVVIYDRSLSSSEVQARFNAVGGQ